MSVMPKTSLVLSNPPVVETVLTIQFADLADWQAVHHGLLFAKIRDKYPKYELQPMQQPILESFPATPKMIRLQFTDKTDAGCANFVDNEETNQLRIQKNRFAFHWVQPQDKPYPHYRENVTNCRTAYREFLEFCQEEKVGELKPVLCEVLYVNHIQPEKDESVAELIESIFGLTTGAFELGTFSRTYVLGSNEGRFGSRLAQHGSLARPGGYPRIP